MQYLHFLVQCFYTPIPSVHCVILVIRARSLPHISAIIISTSWYLLSIYFYIQAIFYFHSLFSCLSLNILTVHLFVSCIFIFSFFLSIMYHAPYAEALQFRCILCIMTIKHSNSNSNNDALSNEYSLVKARPAFLYNPMGAGLMSSPGSVPLVSRWQLNRDCLTG